MPIRLLNKMSVGSPWIWTVMRSMLSNAVSSRNEQLNRNTTSLTWFRDRFGIAVVCVSSSHDIEVHEDKMHHGKELAV